MDPKRVLAIHKIFSDGDLQLAANAVNAACDGADGTADGMVNNLKACTDAVVYRQLERMTCQAVKTDSCMTSGQIKLRKTLNGATRNTKNQELYPAYRWDPGITASANGFRAWWLGTYTAVESNSIRLRLSTPLLLMVWETPPMMFTEQNGLEKYLSYDVAGKDPDPAVNFRASGNYTDAPGVEMINDKTDLTAFKNRGGKLLIYGGTADATSSLNDTIRWYDAMNETMGGNARDFAKLYAVPGMAHRGSGPATDRADFLDTVVKWVETGSAPQRIEASASSPALLGMAKRTRSLCP